MDVNYINPFIKSAIHVFDTMLNCQIKRTGLCMKEDSTPTYEVTSVIGLSGKMSGSVVFSLSRTIAFKIVEQILGEEVNEVNADVADAVGEVTNMIAGGAKAGLAEYELSLGMPNVIVGHNHVIHFPGSVSPLCIQFSTPWGPMVLEVGFDLKSIQPAAPVESEKTEHALDHAEA